MVAAQVSLSSDSKRTDLESLIGDMTPNQIQNFIALFSTQLQSQSFSPSEVSNSHDQNVSQCQASTSGISFSPSTYSFIGILTVSQQSLSTQSWVIDSGATHHVAYDKDLFLSLDSSVMSAVNLPQGSCVRISGVGTIRINNDILLNNVLFIPEFRLNLIRISSLTTDLQTRVIFDPSSCEIQVLTKGSTIGKGKRVGNLYVLEASSSSVSVNVVVDLGMWHKRLGHPSFSRLDVISEALGTHRSKNKGTTYCHICHLSKQKKLSYSSSNNICNSSFELLHIGIWGPFSVETIEGFRYFLTIVDDHSRATWLYLLRTKNEVLQVFPAFIQQVENQYNVKVKSVRSDNAPELRFTDFYKEKGIVSFHSCPETPEQNSVVERKHQHILNVARALMFQSQVPLSSWGDCVQTAVFLINRIPSPVLSDKTPFEILTGKAPAYDQIRTFGCLCYASTSPKQRHKFQPRSRACIFLGYPSGYKGYKLMDIQSNVVFISRNVVFHENIFPLAKTPHSEAALELFTPLDSLSSGTITSSLPPQISAPQISPSQTHISTKRLRKQPAHLQNYHCYSL